MPYSYAELARFAIDKPDNDLVEVSDGGVDRTSKLSISLQQRLGTVTTEQDKPKKNASSVDHGVLLSLFEAGYSPEDVLATFRASKRGQDALQRHSDSWIVRSVAKAHSVAKKSGKRKKGSDGIEPVEDDEAVGSSEDDEELIVGKCTQNMKVREWLWHGHVPLGRLVVLAGDPDLGKSQIAIDLIARVTRGDAMPDGTGGIAPARCGIVTAEDDTAEDIIPRLMATKAKREMVATLCEVRSKSTGKVRFLSLPRDIEIIRRFILKNRLKVLVIDPLNSFVTKGIDTHVDHELRAALSPVEKMAQETRCTVIIVAHLNKKEDASFIYRISGSIAFVGVARSVLAVQKRKQKGDDGKESYALCVTKLNQAKKPPAMQYQIKGGRVREQATGETTSTSLIDWQGTCHFDPNVPGGGSRSGNNREYNNCLEFLIQVFEQADSKALPATEIWSQAKEAGISTTTLKEYKPQFGIGSIKERQTGKWKWVLPEGGIHKYREKVAAPNRRSRRQEVE